MLAKMGYEKGRGLGRNQAGRVEPLELLVKEKRTGLGIDEDRKRKQEEAIQNQTVRGAEWVAMRLPALLSYMWRE